MKTLFNLNSDTTLAYAPLHIVLPYDAPEGDRFVAFQNFLRSPLALLTPTKKVQNFDVMDSLLSNIELNTSGDRPVLVVEFSEKGWDRLAYVFLKDMAAQVKSNPKSMPRSYRSYANLMSKLTEEPTGNGKVDASRKVVIDRTIQQLTDGVRAEITRRVQAWND